jgi:hypothetical protein
MPIISFGSSLEEQSNVSGKGHLIPYAKGPGKFVSAGTDGSVGGVFDDVGNGVAKGIGIGAGLLLFGTAYAWIKSKK